MKGHEARPARGTMRTSSHTGASVMLASPLLTTLLVLAPAGPVGAKAPKPKK